MWCEDYVNDENGDNGEWAAQSKYDNLRTMAAKVKRDAEEARRAEEDKGKDCGVDAPPPCVPEGRGYRVLAR